MCACIAYLIQPCRYIELEEMHTLIYLERIERMVPLRCCCSLITLYKKKRKEWTKMQCNLMIVADTCIVQISCSFTYR